MRDLGRRHRQVLGLTTFGQLGTGTPTKLVVDLGSGRTAKAVSTGHSTEPRSSNDTVKCWGWNAFGQLGYGNTEPRNAPPTVVDLGSGRTAGCVDRVWAHVRDPRRVGHRQVLGLERIMASLDREHRAEKRTHNCGRPWLWAHCEGCVKGGAHVRDPRRRHRQVLGLERSWPARIRRQCAEKRTPTQTVVDLGSGRTAKAVAAGDKHTCAILDDDMYAGVTTFRVCSDTGTTPRIPLEATAVGNSARVHNFSSRFWTWISGRC